MNTTLQIELKKELRDAVKIAAAQLGMTMKEFVCQALQAKIEQERYTH